MERLVLLVRGGTVELFSSVDEAISAIRPGEGAVIVVVAGERLRATVMRVEVSQAAPGGGRDVEPGRKHSEEERVEVVLDQMFRGLGETVARELAGRARIHVVLGRGLERPVERGGVVLWPARDDYDVMKIVEELAGKGRVVLFATGDKRLARQVESLGLPGVVVEYMPPNEYPGKEALIRAVVRRARALLDQVGYDSDGGQHD